MKAKDGINNIQLISDILSLFIIERSDIIWSVPFSQEISQSITNALVTQPVPEN
ncbi:MAG: hypothetical protein K2O69_07565 [Odoribacter sp.]|nr:hypothetical protein [Odoribacter sp.]